MKALEKTHILFYIYKMIERQVSGKMLDMCYSQSNFRGRLKNIADEMPTVKSLMQLPIRNRNALYQQTFQINLTLQLQFQAEITTISKSTNREIVIENDSL